MSIIARNLAKVNATSETVRNSWIKNTFLPWRKKIKILFDEGKIKK